MNRVGPSSGVVTVANTVACVSSFFSVLSIFTLTSLTSLSRPGRVSLVIWSRIEAQTACCTADRSRSFNAPK